MSKQRIEHAIKKLGDQRGKGWGYKDANATNKKTFVATLSMPYSICKHNTFAKKTPEGVAGVGKRGQGESPCKPIKKPLKGVFICACCFNELELYQRLTPKFAIS